MSVRERADVPADAVRELVVQPALWPDLVAWLDARGLDVMQMPVGDDILPTYIPCQPLPDGWDGRA